MTLSRIRNHSFKFVEVEEFELDEMDAGKKEAKLEKQYSSSPSSDKSAVCWHYSYDSRIHISVAVNMPFPRWHHSTPFIFKYGYPREV